jgi:CRP-like cAMP-binding protein
MLRAIVDRSPVLCELGERERAALAAVGRLRRLRSGAYLWKFGDAENGLHVLVEGFVHIGAVRPDGETLVLHVVVPGELMGEPGLYAPERDRRTDGRAVGPATVATFPGDAVRAGLERSPDAMRAFVRQVSQLARGHSRRLTVTASLDARGRVAQLLLDLSASHGKATRAGTRITLPLSQRTLAGLVCLRRESVNRILGAYMRDGVLALDEDAITVLRPQALRAALGIAALG